MTSKPQLGRATAVTAAVAAGALALAACSSSSGGSSTASGSKVKVAAVIKGLDNPFFASMDQGIKAQGATSKLSVTVQAANSVTDTTGQADRLTAMAGQSYSCFIVNPISGTNLIQGLAKIAAAKKTIVNIDNPIDTAAGKAANATPATYIGTDNVQAGTMAGQEMLKLVPSGTVGVIGGVAGDIGSTRRVTGFTTGVGSKLTLLPTVAANWDRQTALTAATNVLRAHPDVKGFFVANDDMGLGVVRAIANAGKAGKVHVVSVDGIKDALTSIQAGQLDASVTQYPYAMGLMSVEACQASALGKTLPANVPSPVALVTKANVAKALASTPKPFAPFTDPFAALLK